MIGRVDSVASGFVGRRVELERLDALLARLETGSFACLAVSGEPGIGKTRLLAELADRAERRRALVLAGRGSELERDLPFGVVDAALGDYLAALGPATLRPLPAGLEVVFPSLEPPGAAAPALEEERFHVFRAFRSLLEELSAKQAVVLELDDLHWADQASLELLDYLLRHPPSTPVLLALAFRSNQAPARLAATVDAAVREGAAERLELAALSPDEAAVLAQPVERALLEPLYAETGGNPFYLLELARSGRLDALRSVGRLPAAPGPVPPLVAAALADELRALSPRALLLAHAAAITGDPFDIDVASRVAELSDSRALESLDELLVAGIAEATDAPLRFRFRHPIVRRAVYESTGAGWRVAAHRRAAEALDAGGAPAAARAHHVARSAARGDEEAIAVLVAAAREAAAHAPAATAAWLRAALMLVPEDEVARRLDLLVPMARALSAAGELEEASSALEEALALLPPEAGERISLTATLAAAEHLLGRHDRGHEHLVAALQQLPNRRSLESTTLLVALALDGLWRNDFETQRRYAAEARASARALGAAALQGTASALLAFAEACLGRAGDGPSLLVEAAALVDGLDDAALAERLDAVHYLAAAEVWSERFDDAARHLRRGIAVARASGRGSLLAPNRFCLASCLTLFGRLGEARQEIQAAVDSARLGGSPFVLSWGLLQQCLVETVAGEDLTSALRTGAEGLALARAHDPGMLAAAGGWALGAALLEAGEPQAATETVLECLGGPDLPLVAVTQRCFSFEVLARAALASGRFDEAAEWAARAERIAAPAARLPLVLPSCYASRARAEVLLASGEPATAAEHARAAVAVCDRVGARLDAACSRTLAGRALAAAGAREQAVAELETAYAALTGFGAKRLAEAAARELRRLGRPVRSRRAKAEPGQPLSARELEIARLVGEGKTNRQIAGTLFLSEKTVETHLARTFRKLGVSSRSAVATTLARQERRVKE